MVTQDQRQDCSGIEENYLFHYQVGQRPKVVNFTMVKLYTKFTIRATAFFELNGIGRVNSVHAPPLRVNPVNSLPFPGGNFSPPKIERKTSDLPPQLSFVPSSSST